MRAMRSKLLFVGGGVLVALAIVFAIRHNTGGTGSEAPEPTEESAESVARAAAAQFQKGDYKRGFQLMEKLGDRPLTRILGKDMQDLVDRVNGALKKAEEAA